MSTAICEADTLMGHSAEHSLNSPTTTELLLLHHPILQTKDWG